MLGPWLGWSGVAGAAGPLHGLSPAPGNRSHVRGIDPTSGLCLKVALGFLLIPQAPFHSCVPISRYGVLSEGMS